MSINQELDSYLLLVTDNGICNSSLAKALAKNGLNCKKRITRSLSSNKPKPSNVNITKNKCSLSLKASGYKAWSIQLIVSPLTGQPG